MIKEIKAESSVSIKLKIKCSNGIFLEIPLNFSLVLEATWAYTELTLSTC